MEKQKNLLYKLQLCCGDFKLRTNDRCPSTIAKDLPVSWYGGDGKLGRICIFPIIGHGNCTYSTVGQTCINADGRPLYEYLLPYN
jgi:hypothetical protein